MSWGLPRFRRQPPQVLATQTETIDQRAITLDVVVLQVVEQTTALADEQQQATTAVVVVLVLLEVLGQMRDPAGQEGNLHLRGAGVAVAERVLLDDLCLGHVRNGG